MAVSIVPVTGHTIAIDPAQKKLRKYLENEREREREKIVTNGRIRTHDPRVHSREHHHRANPSHSCWLLFFNNLIDVTIRL